MRKACLIFCLALLLGLAAQASAQDRLRMATTTSTENSGLLQVLIPPFEKQNHIKVDVIVSGTGKALALGRRCDVDLVMVHAPALEKKFVEQGHGIERRRIMHNYFVIVGPADDPAGAAQASNAAQAVKRIAEAKAKFVSRGDNSGTNVKENALWKAAGMTPAWPGYLEAGQGMGAVLTMAGQMEAYTLTDIGTYLKYKSLGKLDLKVLFSKDPLLKNPYSVILVNPARCPRVHAAAARALGDYLVSDQGQKVVQD